MQAGNQEAYDALVDRCGEPDHPSARYARAYVSGDCVGLHGCLPAVASELEASGDEAMARFIQLMSIGPLLSTGRFSEVDELASALVERHRQQGPPSLLHQALQTLGYSAPFQQRAAEAQRHFDEAASVDVPIGTLSANGAVAARSAFRRGDRARAVEILRGYIDELLEIDNVVAASVVSIEFIDMMAAMERLAEAAHMIRYPERANDFGALAAKTLVAESARTVAANAGAALDVGPPHRCDDRHALVFLREALIQLPAP